MILKIRGFWSATLLVAAAAGLAAQPQDRPTFSVQVNLVTNDVVVRDADGNFVPDLKKEDFEIYEDGVRQDIVSMTLTHGGRVTNVLAAPPAPAPEGIILPPPRPVASDVSGRVFLFFVDDLHVEFSNTGRLRDLFRRITSDLVHDGDMFAIVSSGPSSIAVDMTYDKRRLEEAIKKMTGNELRPSDIIATSSGPDGPAEVRYRAHTAFSTVYDVLRQLEQIHNRRKAVVYVSDGYDFNPFQDARLGTMDPNSPFQQNPFTMLRNQSATPEENENRGRDPEAEMQRQSEQFSDADLAREIAELTRQANRANATIYTIDPRGLVAGTDIGEQVDPMQYQAFVTKTQDSLRVLADETGGIAVVNQNDFDKALERIDAELSDYYVLGYYSNNPDPTRRRREIQVKARKDGLPLEVIGRKEYVLKPLPGPVVAKP
ncbi:MAG: VWA domain-containing protein [Acidobacteria bacterium]|nr:VWA domain-containing protein [Acidobacteriota bacterium]